MIAIKDFGMPSCCDHCEDLFKKAMKSLDFAEWVASEIMPDIEWINNRDAFPELACRRLEKLGIVREDNGMWVRTYQKGGK